MAKPPKRPSQLRQRAKPSRPFGPSKQESNRNRRKALRATRRSQLQQAQNAAALAAAIRRYDILNRTLLSSTLPKGGPSLGYLHRQSVRNAVRLASAGTAGMGRPQLADGRQSFHFKITYLSNDMPEGDPVGARKAAAHQAYIEREQAVLHASSSADPSYATPSFLDEEDSGPIAYGNIGITEAERGEFWKEIQKTERVSYPTRLRINPNVAPEWWEEVRNNPSRVPAKLQDLANHEIVVNTIASAVQLGQAHPTAIEYASALTSAARFHPFDTPIPASIAAIVRDGHPGTPSPDERAEAIDWTQRTLGGTANALINATPQELLDGLERIELGLAKPDKHGTYDIPIPTERQFVVAEWLKANRKRAKDLPVRMIEGRPGRIQVRVVGELPHELSSEGHRAIVASISKFLGEKNIPHWITVHKPDANGDKRNWHWHLVYNERPCSRLADGRWDFAITQPGWKPGILLRPFMQKKDREFSDRQWPKIFRALYADIVNEQLKREGISNKRYDPRSYEEMGIATTPGQHTDPATQPANGADQADAPEQFGTLEAAAAGLADRGVNPIFHLDTNASARERRGEPTEIGTSASIERSLRVLERTERQYKEAIAAARQDVARWKDSPEARPLIAEYLAIRRRQASLTRERALFQEAKRAALSRPTAAMRHFERLVEPLKAAPRSPNRAGRLAGLNRKIAEHQKNIDQIRRTLDPLWDGLEARSSDLRQQDLPRLEQLTRALDGIARQRGRTIPTRDDHPPAR